MNVATLQKKFEKTEANQSRFVIGKVVLLLGLSGHLLFSVVTTDRWLDDVSTLEGFGMPPVGDINSTATTIHLASNVSFSTANFTATNPSRHLPIYIKHSTVFSTDNEFHDLRAPLFSDRIPLIDLVKTGPDPECHSTADFNMSIFNSIIVDDESITHPPKRKIPRIIHMTSKSRCITSRIKDNILKWKFPEYSIYFHDEAAVDRLLSKYFPGFPHLQNVKQCSISGAAKADIWRYLVLWEYGGIYTDIDNAPGKNFQAGSIIKDKDEAWFVVERIGVLSQYFMASSKNHPIMYLALMQCLARLVSFVNEIGTQYVPYITGPGVTKAAMMLFMKDQKNFQTVKAGTYRGFGGRSITVAGSRKNSNKWIRRDSIEGKQKDYSAMKMKHFSHSKNKKFKDSCYEYMYKQAIKPTETIDET